MKKIISKSSCGGLEIECLLHIPHPRATHQGSIKYRHHVTVPAVPTQEAIAEEGV